MDPTAPSRPGPVENKDKSNMDPVPPSTALLIRDGVLHTFSRAKKKEKQRKSPRFEDSMPNIGDYFNMNVSPDEILSVTASSPNAAVPKKGILKAPRVHFPFPEEADDSSKTAPLPLSSPFISPPPSFVPPDHMYTGPHVPPALPPLPPPPPPPPEPTEKPPPLDLFDPSIDENEYLSEIAYKLYTKFMDELEDFVELQGRVIGMRLMVQEKRQQLKILRDAVSKCDAVFMDHLRFCMAEGIKSDDAQLMKLFNEAQQARDYVGPFEAEYEPAEVKLGADENQLKEKYSHIESRFGNFFRLKATPSTNASMPSKIDYDPPTEPTASGGREFAGAEPRQSDPFQGAYIGDDKVGVGELPLDMANFHLSEEDLHREGGVRPLNVKLPDSSEQNRKRRATGTSSEDPGHQRSSDPPGVDDSERQSQLARAKTGARNKSIQESLTGISDRAVSFDDSTQALDNLVLEPGFDEVDTILLRESDSDTRSTLSEYLTSFGSTRDRVNRWLLHKLRVSPREAFALRREIMESSSGVQDWATVALRVWPLDDSGSGQAYIHGSVEDPYESPPAQRYAPPPFPDAAPGIERRPKGLPHRPRSASASNFAHAPTNDDPQNQPPSNLHTFGKLSAAALRSVSSL